MYLLYTNVLKKSKIFDRAIKHYKGENMTIEWEEFLDKNQITYQKAPSKLIRFIKSMKKS